MKILVIQQKMIGDVLTSSILCERLKQHDKNTEIHYLINKSTFPVVENNPFIDQFIFFISEEKQNYRKLYRFIKLIRKQHYDIIIDAYGKLSSQLITLFSKTKTKIGYHKSYTAFIYTNTIKRNKKPSKNVSLAIENRMKLLEPLQISFKPIEPKIYLTVTEVKQAKSIINKFKIVTTKPIYMISVLGSNAKKTYPANYMASLLDTIIKEKKEAQLLFNYIPNQTQQAKEILNFCKPETQKHIYFDLFGKNLREFLALTYHCHALIGNEGGAINMAKALHKPTFIIFNPALNKANWFGDSENTKNMAVHLSDFSIFDENDKQKAKQNPKPFYLKFKPSFIKPKLVEFLNQL
ncbi:MAG: glycosyltransferase family 9 protein [Flavobacteriales bacterium]